MPTFKTLTLIFCSYSAQQVVGVPNVFMYGDNKMAWKQGSGRGDKEEYLHVSCHDYDIAIYTIFYYIY